MIKLFTAFSSKIGVTPTNNSSSSSETHRSCTVNKRIRVEYFKYLIVCGPTLRSRDMAHARSVQYNFNSFCDIAFGLSPVDDFFRCAIHRGVILSSIVLQLARSSIT